MTSRRRVGAMFLGIFFSVVGVSALFNFKSSFELALGAYIVAILFDKLSTYLFARKRGIEAFFSKEVNKATVACVRRWGLVWGLLLSYFHWRHFRSLAIIFFCGLIWYVIISYCRYGFCDYAASFAINLIAIGALRITAALNNTYLIFRY